MKEHVQRTFGSALSLQSSSARSLTKDVPYLEGERTSLSLNVPLPRLSVAEVLHDSSAGESALLVTLFVWNPIYVLQFIIAIMDDFSSQLQYNKPVIIYDFIKILYVVSQNSSFSEWHLVLQTDVLSPQKLAAIVSPSHQRKLLKPLSADDETTLSSSPRSETVEPLACKLPRFLLLQIYSHTFHIFWINWIPCVISPSKLIWCKHFPQQKALFEEGLTISGWMMKFFLDFLQKTLTQLITSVTW